VALQIVERNWTTMGGQVIRVAADDRLLDAQMPGDECGAVVEFADADDEVDPLLDGLD